MQRNSASKSGYAGIALAAAIVGFGTFKVANAGILNPGGVYVFASGDDLSSLPSGTVIKTQTNNFTGTNGSSTVFSGTIESEVIQNNAGDDDFVYQISNTSGPDSIDRLALVSYAGFNTSVFYNSPASGDVAPSYADRSSDGSIVGFNFDPPNEIAPGSDSDFLIVETNSTTWTEGNGSLIDGGSGDAQVTVPTFTTITTVPEPGTVALLAIGSTLLLRRRQNLHN